MAKTLFYKILITFSSAFILRISCSLLDLSLCHDDYTLDPKDGVLEAYSFPWLGVVHYKEEISGKIYDGKAPRVVLIHRQFVLSLTAELLNITGRFKLAHVIFGEYEREEYECGLSTAQIKQAVRCPRACLIVPILEVLPNPEYLRFGIYQSIALIKLAAPVKSYYVLPICLPSREERIKKKFNSDVYLIDYLTDVPLTFDGERMGKKTLKLSMEKKCPPDILKKGSPDDLLNVIMDNKDRFITHTLCTSGCGMRPGAPIILRSSTGRFELVGLAVGGPECLDVDMRNTFNPDPPVFIDVFPYTTWITNMITAHEIPKAYPSNSGGRRYMGYKRQQVCQWQSRSFCCGDCAKKLMMRRRIAFFYMEEFYVKGDDILTNLEHVEIIISAGPETTIECARIILPSRMPDVFITGIGQFNLTLVLRAGKLPDRYKFTLLLYGTNSTKNNYHRFKQMLMAP